MEKERILTTEETVEVVALALELSKLAPEARKMFRNMIIGGTLVEKARQEQK